MTQEITSTLGWVGVASAIIFFGIMNVPIKIPPVQRTKVDPMVLQLYYSFTIFASSWLLLLFSDKPFHFSYWGIIGASLWVPASLFSIFALRFLGLSVAQGLWSGLTILVSFLWGAVVFRDPVKNGWLTALGMILLLLGIFGVAMCKSDDAVAVAENDKQEHSESAHLNHDDDDDVESRLQHSKSTNPSVRSTAVVSSVTASDDRHEIETQLTEQMDVPMTKKEKAIALLKKSKDFILGVLCCVGLGLFNGSMMVPARFNPDKSIIYCLSFGIGVLIVTPVLFVIYFLVKREIPKFHPKETLFPGLLVGFIWNLGNVGSTVAALSPLGLTVGFPLTQCALVVGGIIGIVFFRELRGWKAILQFTVFTLLFLLPGCMLLALFGKK